LAIDAKLVKQASDERPAAASSHPTLFTNHLSLDPPML
jgi:hypothetical protein